MNIIAVDIGTSRIKAACFDETGNMSLICSQRLARAESPVTQDAGEWISVSFKLLQEIVSHLTTPADAVVLTGNMHALLGIDSAGDPVAPAVLWSDNSAQREADELNKNYCPLLTGSFGNRATPVFTLPKIMRMKKYSPELYAKTQSFMQSKDFLALCLTGVRATEPTDASGVLGMDLASQKWDEGFLADLKLDRSKFPEIIPTASICGKVTAEAAKLTGLNRGTPVIIGSGDLASAAVGSGVDKETISLTLGTAGQLLAAGSRGSGKKIAEKLFVFAHADPECDLFLGSVPAGGFSFEWFAKLHNISLPQFFELASQSPLSSDLPVFMPYILGRGAPYMDYENQGAWFGLSAKNSLAELCRAATLGPLCALRQCADILEELSGKRHNLVLQALAYRENAVKESAGALFTQKKFIPVNSEASLSGAAVIGLTALGIYPDIKSASAAMINKKEYIFAPDQTADNFYRKYLKYAQLMDIVCKKFREHNFILTADVESD